MKCLEINMTDGKKKKNKSYEAVFREMESYI